MRLLFVNIGYPPFVGGAQTYVQQLAESLTADGHAVTVLTTDAAEIDAIWSKGARHLPATSECVNGVTVRRLPLAYIPGSSYAFYALRRLTVSLASIPGVPHALLNRLAGYTPWLPDLPPAIEAAGPVDVVHGFAIPFESLLIPAADYATARNIPFFLTPFLHTGPAGSAAVSRGYAMPHQLDLLRTAHKVIALTETERAFLVNKGISKDRVSAIPAGIPLGVGGRHPSEFVPSPLVGELVLSQVEGGQGEGSSPAHPTVLFLGAATYEKGAVHLIQAMQRLWADGSTAELVLLGTTTEQFRRPFDQLPASDKARSKVLGVVSDDEKHAWLEQCTLLAMPSRVDSFGLVFLEAWEHGKPVIGARAGGIPDVVDDGENGLLVPFGDVEALATALNRLLTNPSYAAELGAAGREKLERTYDWRRIYPQLLSLYEEAVVSA